MNRTITFILICCCFAGLQTLYAQTQPGFVQQDVILQSQVTSNAQFYNLTNTGKQTTRLYYDGLGRGLQTVAVQGSPLQNDMIQPVAYDAAGRQPAAYLPYSGSTGDATGSYRANAIPTAQPAFYNQTSQHLIPVDADPFAQQVFDNSPLNRVLQAGDAGAGFQPVSGQHYKTISYRYNQSGDGNILVWNENGTVTGNNTYYPVNTLSVTDGTDEDGLETQVFADLAGRTILKRQILSGGNLDTYYIYNEAGSLNYIVPPKALVLMGSDYDVTLSGVSRLVFNYKYDNYGRMTTKTLPGNISINIVYDPLFRPVLIQDANLAANFQWNYIKYDVKGRAISQGIYTDPNHYSPSQMQTAVNGMTGYSTAWYESKNGTAATGYYTNNIFPSSSITPLAYSFFDNYDLLNNGTSYYTYHTSGLPGEVGATAAKLRGMPTMVYKSTVGTGLAATWLMSVQFYDHDLHPIQVQTNNLLYTALGPVAVTDYKTNEPDFVGAPLYSLTSVKSSSTATTSVQTNISYDPMHRITAIAQGYNTTTVTQVAAYSYNELGQVIMKSLGYVNATTWLQNVNFRYGIRGQLLYINNSKLANDGGVTSNDNNDMFGMQLLYDVADPGLSNTPYYDGRIAAVKWMTKDGSNNKSNERSYQYQYDGVARDKASVYGERLSNAPTNTAFSMNADGYDESAVTYDANGNILTLNRNASTEGGSSPVTIDILHYTYSSTLPNQLYTVTDNTGNIAGFGIQTGGSASGHYVYDANGNVTTDPYKALGITYNVLNKTDKINFTAISGQYINYIYDAGGMVMEKQQYITGSTTPVTTIYKDGFVFINGTLSYFTMPEGRVLNNSGTLSQQFIITDQQGNARITFDNSGTGGTAKVLQENSYYAFGMVMAGSPVATPAVPNKNLYNGGSEWQNDYTNQPDVYQTFNRNYDAAIGRFMGVDPSPESAASMTNYQYAGNNPIMFNDPGGSKFGPTHYGNPNYNEFQQEESDLFWQGVDLNIQLGNTSFDGVFAGSGSGGSNYAGQNIGTDQNGNLTATPNGLNYDTHYNWDEIAPVFADALAFVGANVNPSGQGSGGDMPPVGSTGPVTGINVGDGNPILAIAGPNFGALYGSNPYFGSTVTVVYYVGKPELSVPGYLYQTQIQPFVGHIYGTEGKILTTNVTLRVSTKPEIMGYDIGTPYGIGSGTDYEEVENDLNYSNENGGSSIGVNYENGYRTFITYFTLSNGNIQGLITTIIPTGQKNLDTNLENLYQYLFPPRSSPTPFPAPSPIFNPAY